jgi:hypothetical protein
MASISANASMVEQARQIGSIVAYALFLRFVGFMSLHPRIALMVDTIRNITDDVVHFIITGSALFCTLAFQGFWSFGMDDPAFESFTMAMWTQFQMIIGFYPWPPGGVRPGFQGIMQVAYLLIFTFLVFFILLNFFLAIVVDAFTRIKQEVAINRAENPFAMDLIDCGWSLIVRVWKKYPSPSLVLKILRQDLPEQMARGKDGMNGHDIDFDTFIKCNPIIPNAVTAEEVLEKIVDKEGSKIFQSTEHAQAYINWYSHKVKDEQGYGLEEKNPLKIGTMLPPVDVSIPKIDLALTALEKQLTGLFKDGVPLSASNQNVINSTSAAAPFGMGFDTGAMQVYKPPIEPAQQLAVYETVPAERNGSVESSKSWLFQGCCSTDTSKIEEMYQGNIPLNPVLSAGSPYAMPGTAMAPSSLDSVIQNYAAEASRLLAGIQMLSQNLEEYGTDESQYMFSMKSEMERIEAHVRDFVPAAVQNVQAPPPQQAVPLTAEALSGLDQRNPMPKKTR